MGLGEPKDSTCLAQEAGTQLNCMFLPNKKRGGGECCNHFHSLIQMRRCAQNTGTIVQKGGGKGRGVRRRGLGLACPPSLRGMHWAECNIGGGGQQVYRQERQGRGWGLLPLISVLVSTTRVPFDHTTGHALRLHLAITLQLLCLAGFAVSRPIGRT